MLGRCWLIVYDAGQQLPNIVSMSRAYQVKVNVNEKNL